MIVTLSSLLEKISHLAFEEAFPEAFNHINAAKMTKIMITEASSEEFGHFQCNYALQVAKPLKMAPPQIAAKWVEQIKKLCEQQEIQPEVSGINLSSHKFSEIIGSVEIKGPGFINFRIHPKYLAKQLQTALHDETGRFGIAKTKTPLKTIIEYSSPNIAKELHVGHLRSTIIGDALNRMFRFLGHDVLALNHVGDWGTQFGMLIAYIKSEVNGNDDAHKNDTNAIQQKIQDKTPGDLVEWYKAAKQKFDADPAFKKKAQLEVVALQSGEADSRATWKLICDISRSAYQDIYKLLDIDPLLTERGESYYDKMLANTVKKLEQVKINGKDLVTVSDGAKCIFLEGFTNRDGDPLPLILQKSDGGYNYSTTDLTALDHRVNIEHKEAVFYVVDAGQSLHFQMVFKAAELAGFFDPNKVRIEHVPFGLVLRSDGKKFKTREGETERLIDLIQNAINKAKEILQARNPELSGDELQHMAEVLGINAIKYADLSCNRESNYVFSYDRMLQFEGNTAAFIMYAYVRVLSIQRKIEQKSQIKISDLIARDEPLVLEAPAEIALAVLLCQFEDVLLKMQDDLMPNRLTDYLYRLAEKFHLFFHQCRVEGSPEQNSRLLLCEACARVLKQGMELLGLRPLERM